MNGLNMFCIPYAGGDAQIIYRSWQELMGGQYNIIPLSLVGRGGRIKEKPYEDCCQAVDDMISMINSEIAAGPYVLFGHSMGGLLAYLLTLRIQDMGLPCPSHLFLSGRAAPHVKGNHKTMHILSDEEFLHELNELNTMDTEMLHNKQFRDIFLPIIRMDYKIIENWTPGPAIRKVHCALTAFCGTEDKSMTPMQVSEWKHYTTTRFSQYNIRGNHFFIQSERKALIDLILRTAIQ